MSIQTLLAGRKDKDTGEWIKGARDRRDDVQRLLTNGVDPSEQRKSNHAVTERAANSFEAVAREWIASFQEVGTRTTQQDPRAA